MKSANFFTALSGVLALVVACNVYAQANNTIASGAKGSSGTSAKATKEADCTLLDNSMIVYGAGLSDGNAHLHEDLPTLIAGRGGNYIKTGRRMVVRRETPMCNLFLTMMDRMGVHTEKFGDSTGRLQGLDLG